MGKLRIVFVMEDLCYGGTQRQTLQLAQRLDRRKYTPVMVTLTGKTDLDDEARALGIEVHHMGHGREVDTVFFLRLLHTLKDLDPSGAGGSRGLREDPLALSALCAAAEPLFASTRSGSGACATT